MDQLSAMRTFRKVIECGGFSAAARQIGMSKAAVSKQITELEARLGAALIHRTTRRLNTTEAGRRYFERCSRLLDEIDAADADVRNAQAEPSGRLRVSAPISFASMMLGPVTTELVRLHPKLAIQFELNDRFVDLIEEGFDAAIRIRTDLPDSSLIARRLCGVPRFVVAAPSYLKKHGIPQKPEELQSHNCLIYTLSTSPYDWQFKMGKQWRGVRVSGAIEANNGQFLLAPLREGVGIACLPEFVVSAELKSGKLRKLLTEYPVADHSLYVVYPQNRHQSPKVRAFVDLMAAHFRDGPGKERSVEESDE